MPAQILLPIDGNGAQTQRALAEAIRIHRRDDVPVYLLSVQPPVNGHVASYFGASELQQLQHETALEELAPAKDLLEAAGVRYRLVVRVGRRAETIANAAQELGCDRILLGDTAEGGSGWFGSIAQQVRHLLQARNARLVTVI